MASDPRKRGPAAVAVGGRTAHRRRVGWLLPLIALLLVAALAATLLFGGDDDDRSTARDASTATAVPTATTDAAVGAAGTTGGADAILSADGQQLRGDDAQSLTAAVGQQATGTQAKVLSVADGTGFWVGSSDADRVFVEYGSTVGSDESQPYKPKVGDVVALRGEVRPAPEDPAQTLKLAASDAEQLKAQGAYINAQDVQAQ